MEQIKVLFLTLNPNIQGPLPKHNPLLIAALENEGCQVFRSTWGRHSDNENIFEKLFGRFYDLVKAILILIRVQPNVMYVATTLDEYALARDIPLMLSTWWFPARKILKMHGSKTAPLARPGYSLYKLLTRLLIHLSDAILLLSSEEQNKWQQFYPKGKFYVVDNPFVVHRSLKAVTPDSLWNVPMDRLVVFFVGRLITEKGVYELIDALPLVLESTPCHLLMAGDGPELAGLREKAHNLGITQHITFTGYLESGQLTAAYQRADILVLPSYREGFPTAITEAMSEGLPIVSTPVGGIVDHLENEINALFVPPRDPVALSLALIRLLKNPDIRAHMSDANREKIKSFAPSTVGRKYFEILKEVVSQ